MSNICVILTNPYNLNILSIVKSEKKNKGINKNTLDTVDDLIGYLVLLKIAINDEENEKKN